MIWLTKVSVVREDLAPAEEYIPFQDQHLQFAETCDQVGLCGLREARQAVEAAMDRLIAICDMCALNQAAIKDLPAIIFGGDYEEPSPAND